MTQPYVAPGHRLSDEDWAIVEARAAEIRAELEANAQGGASGPDGIVVDMTAVCVRSRKYFPVSGIPTQLLVLHSAECPLRAGFAISLTEWFSNTIYPQAPIASWQRFVDPVHRVRAVPDELGAWHASEANPLSIGWEQAGYARFSRAEWLSPEGRAQMELLAFDMAEVAVRDGIPPRWLTDAEVRAVLDRGDRSIKGFCFHRQIDPETRTDPGGGYPADLLMDRIKFYMDGGSPTPNGNFLMALSDKQQQDIYWILCTHEGRNALADHILKRDLTWWGPDGKPQPEGGRRTVTVADVTGWFDHAIHSVLQRVEGVRELVEAGPVVKVDLDPEQLDTLAAQLREGLGAEVAAELAKRLAD